MKNLLTPFNKTPPSPRGL